MKLTLHGTAIPANTVPNHARSSQSCKYCRQKSKKRKLYASTNPQILHLNINSSANPSHIEASKWCHNATPIHAEENPHSSRKPNAASNLPTNTEATPQCSKLPSKKHHEIAKRCPEYSSLQCIGCQGVKLFLLKDSF